jgi:aspartyl protease family protein
MATLFMPHIIALFLLLACGAAGAADIALVGIIGDKAAVLAVDGGDPKTVKVGQKWSGITVIAIEKNRATVEIDGKRLVLTQGPHHRNSVAANTRQSLTLSADERGHFNADGGINGIPVRFLVDTGSTYVALPARDAQRIGLDYRKGARERMQTANGPVAVFRVRLDSVRVGHIEISSVEGLVVEEGLPIALLGMSFLNQVDMRRDGQTMSLVRSF